MDDVTQQNAALVEEAAAAAESLQSQAEQLANRVSAFKLDDSQDNNSKATKQPKRLSGSNTKKREPAKRELLIQRKIKAQSPEEDEWENF
jgi:methyl-accepting chemotaxis protein